MVIIATSVIMAITAKMITVARITTSANTITIDTMATRITRVINLNGVKTSKK